MILAADAGARTFGWAIVTPGTGRVVELGELFQDDVRGASAGGANTARIHAQARLLGGLVTRHRVTKIAGEARSLGGPPAARLSMAAAQSCCWGGLAALAALHSIELVEVNTQVWQHGVLGRPGKVDYAEVFAALSTFVAGAAAAQLAEIPASRRNHALDAAGVGVFTAMRPDEVTRLAPVLDKAAKRSARRPRKGRAA